jgi:hypothetical protein
MASLCSSWSWIIIMAAVVVPFVIAVAGRAMLILVAAMVHVIVMPGLFPLLGSAISTGFSSWRLVSAASVMAPSPLAVVVTYDNSSLRDLECLILWWWHIGLMAGSGFVLMVSIGRVILVRR